MRHVGEAVGKAPSGPVGEDVNWCSHDGKQCGRSSKHQHDYHVTQQSFFWIVMQNTNKRTNGQT